MVRLKNLRRLRMKPSPLKIRLQSPMSRLKNKLQITKKSEQQRMKKRKKERVRRRQSRQMK